MPGWLIVLVSFAYLGVLFAIAYYGDKRADAGASIINNPTVYALSLAVYATTWTFYGSIGRAAVSGIGFLPIYLGPTLMAALWWIVQRKIIRISKTNHITSIADFIASRYGKSALLGGLVTVVAVVGVVPYIALQLKAISSSFLVMTNFPALGRPHGALGSLWFDSTFYIALLLAAFTILFGTRHLDAAERHEGMVAAVAFESLVKLVAFLAVGIFVTFGMYGGFADLFAHAAAQPKTQALLALGVNGVSSSNWSWLIGLSMLSILFLPRQFQIAVVENINERHLDRAIWLLPLYLLVINIFVLPIAFGGLMHFPNGDADTFILTLPLLEGHQGLALLVFIGGLSAATGMVIVETIALSTMVCNDLMMPLLLRFKPLRLNQRANLSGLLLNIRRATIVGLMMLGYGYFRLVGEAYALVSIGLISFAAVAQFAPAMLGGIFWKNGNRNGALFGLAVGFLLWGYTLLLPSFAQSGWVAESFLTQGPFGIWWLKPTQLFGLTGMDQIAHSLFWSMLANCACYIGISVTTRQSGIEKAQAMLFVDAYQTTSRALGSRLWRGNASPAALRQLLQRFLGPERTEKAFARFQSKQGKASARRGGAGDRRGSNKSRDQAELVQFVEIELAGAIGTASARVMIATVVEEEPLSLDEVMSILDETSQVLAYSRQLEQQSRELEAASAELKAANHRLTELDHLKDEFVSTVTHELRTPLTSIRAFSEILRDNPELESGKRTEYLDIVLKESERLTRLINDVLDLAKIESGQQEWQTEALDLRDVIQDALNASSQLFQQKNIQLELDLPPAAADFPLAMADHDRLMQVLLNLLSNAAKFCDPVAGRVSVALDILGNSILVAIGDNGAGVREQDSEIIFEKFRQGGDTQQGKPQGTGLGLPISREIIRHFGGTLWLEPPANNTDTGALFAFTLPQMEKPNAP